MSAKSAPAATIKTVLPTFVAYEDTHVDWAAGRTYPPDRPGGMSSSVRGSCAVLTDQ